MSTSLGERIYRNGQLVALAVGLCAATPAFAQPGAGDASAIVALQEAFGRAIKQSEQSVVAIARYKVDTSEDERRIGFDRLPERREPGTDLIPNEFGTGIIIAPADDGDERFVLTNYHVVRGFAAREGRGQSEERLHVQLPNFRGFFATVYAADPRSDLAVIRIDRRGAGLDLAELKPIGLGDADALRKGQFVLALGNPYAIARDGSASASWGIVSNISRRPNPLAQPLDPRETIHHFGTLLHLDTRLNLGSSGGAVVDLEGKLVGITTSLAAIEGYEKSVGFAIPVDSAIRRVAETLMKGYEVEYGFLGIHPQNAPPELLRGLPGDRGQRAGVLADKVYPDTPAASGGLQTNDVILEVNGKVSHDKYDLMREIGLLSPGEPANLLVWRPGPGRLVELTVKLGKWPVLDADGIIAPNRRHEPWRGLTVDHPTGRHKFIQIPIERYPHAVAVAAVRPGSAAEAAQLQVGEFITHVDDRPVETPEQFHKAADLLQGDVTLRLLDGRRIVVKK